MWVFRELLRLLEKIAIGFAIAFAFAAVWAALSKHSFWSDFRNTCWLVGGRAVASTRRGERTALVVGDSVASAASLATAIASS